MIKSFRGRQTYEDILRLPGGQTGPPVSPGLRHQGDEGQLREVLGGHLQPARDHGLERQLHGAPEPEDSPGQVRTVRPILIQQSPTFKLSETHPIEDTIIGPLYALKTHRKAQDAL